MKGIISCGYNSRRHTWYWYKTIPWALQGYQESLRVSWRSWCCLVQTATRRERGKQLPGTRYHTSSTNHTWYNSTNYMIPGTQGPGTWHVILVLLIQTINTCLVLNTIRPTVRIRILLIVVLSIGTTATGDRIQRQTPDSNRVKRTSSAFSSSLGGTRP